MGRSGPDRDPFEREELALVGERVLAPEPLDYRSSEKWLHTGDLAVRDEADYPYFRSRLDDALRVRGFLLAPREIERVLDDHRRSKDHRSSARPTPDMAKSPSRSSRPPRGPLSTRRPSRTSWPVGSPTTSYPRPSSSSMPSLEPRALTARRSERTNSESGSPIVFAVSERRPREDNRYFGIGSNDPNRARTYLDQFSGRQPTNDPSRGTSRASSARAVAT